MSDRSASLSVGLCFLCLYLLTAGGHYGGDGFWSYLTAESIVLDRDLIDISWANALRTGLLGDPAAVGLRAVVALLLVAWVLSARKVIQWAGTTAVGER